VAEGIETDAVLERLAVLGCDTGQGYVISRPVPADQLTGRLLADLESVSSSPGVGVARAAPRSISRPIHASAPKRSRSSTR
jgi:predicted signal transduction protein with EAL and GGDEF domain